MGLRYGYMSHHRLHIPNHFVLHLGAAPTLSRCWSPSIPGIASIQAPSQYKYQIHHPCRANTTNNPLGMGLADNRGGFSSIHLEKPSQSLSTLVHDNRGGSPLTLFTKLGAVSHEHFRGRPSKLPLLFPVVAAGVNE